MARNLPPANISGQINMAAGSGKIALVSSFTGARGQLSDLRSEHQGPRRLRQRRLPRRIDDDAGGE